MNRESLKAILADLETTCFRLTLELTDQDRPNVVASQFQHALDNAQQRMDDARSEQKLCVRCGKFWALATIDECARCTPHLPYMPRAYTPEERAEQQQEIGPPCQELLPRGYSR